MATAGKERGPREERERARVYQARQTMHLAQQRRRTRDNLIAGLVGGLLILAVIGGQVAYFTLGAGAPAPEPSPTSTTTPAPSATPPATPEPSATPTP